MRVWLGHTVTGLTNGKRGSISASHGAATAANHDVTEASTGHNAV